MSIVNVRTQHPVGQGFFHSASIDAGDGRRVSYVCDCGAMKKFGKTRDARVDAYLNDRGPGADLDLLFISHVHADHVNGLPRLLDAGKGLKVRTIVLPLTDPAERAMAFTRAMAVDRGSAAGEFYTSFVVDPATALARFSPDLIMFVRPGTPDERPPVDTEPPARGPEGPRLTVGADGRAAPWKLVGGGTIQSLDNGTDAQTPLRKVVIPDSLAVSVDVGNLTWLLLPYVDPMIVSLKKRFLAALARS